MESWSPESRIWKSCGRPASQHRGQAREHLARRLVREGDREHPGRAHGAGLDEVGDARGEHARLAAAGPGEDEGGFARKGDGPELLGIETGKEIGHGIRTLLGCNYFTAGDGPLMLRVLFSPATPAGA
jgi:hypothetical protein